ncbi:MAG TPA: hypothetical protein VJQ56_01895 [Blastocatellia bacterium]|nr:hypothetical protein [Blastocatellia bacterium]
MYFIKRILFVTVLVSVAAAQSIDPPLSDTRLSIHTLLREDIFAGFLADDMERFSRGERNIELLLEKRPNVRYSLLAWKAGAALYHAVRAHENKQPEEFKKHYQRAVDLFAEASKTSPSTGEVEAITGGSYALLADRLPQEYRAAGWGQAYAAYQTLWKMQAPALDKLPVHFRGELLGGLAQSAQRTGRTQEVDQYLDKMLAVLADTPYEKAARRWKENPKSAANTSITCLSCHDAGRLAPRMNALSGK